jgi:hypothetical protein
VRVVDTLKRELQQRQNMPLLTELEKFGLDFYKYDAPDGAWFIPRLTQPPLV